MSIFITGDMHGEYSRFEDERLKGLKEGDYLIVCGDFGFIWASEKKDDFEILVENKQLDDLEKTLPYTVLFIDGNHENFDRLEKYPEAEKFGNKVHKIRENIYHLERGRVYTIEEKNIFCMGGAASIDKYMRIPGLSWWHQELPSEEEYERATESLKQCNYKFDYVLTHTAPVEVIKQMGFNPYRSEDLELTSYLSYVMEQCPFKQWYFGHWHIDEEIELTKSNLFSKERKPGDSIKSEVKSFRAIYYDVVPIGE